MVGGGGRGGSGYFMGGCAGPRFAHRDGVVDRTLDPIGPVAKRPPPEAGEIDRDPCLSLHRQECPCRECGLVRSAQHHAREWLPVRTLGVLRVGHGARLDQDVNWS